MYHPCSSCFQIPVAWLSLFDVICIILLLPLFDRAIYPALDRRGHSPPVRTRIIIGMLFSGGAIITAGLLEMCRREIYHLGHIHNQTIGKRLTLSGRERKFVVGLLKMLKRDKSR